MIVNCRQLRNILSFRPYLSVKCIRTSLPKIVDRIDGERGEAPRAGLPNIIYTTASHLDTFYLLLLKPVLSRLTRSSTKTEKIKTWYYNHVPHDIGMCDILNVFVEIKIANYWHHNSSLITNSDLLNVRNLLLTMKWIIPLNSAELFLHFWICFIVLNSL